MKPSILPYVAFTPVALIFALQGAGIASAQTAPEPQAESFVKIRTLTRPTDQPLRGAGLRKTITMRTLSAVPADSPDAPVERLPQVTSLAIDPRIANWDADVETDGLVIDIAPLDGVGNLIPANAVAEIELFAPQRRDFALAPMSGGDTLELVERWTQPIQKEHYGTSGARLRLPFGAVHPELRPEWSASWYGLVHVRLVVPGHGVFEDSRDGVRIRPWAPNRDRLEHKTGQGFLPTERQGRTE